MSNFGELLEVLTRDWCERCGTARTMRFLLYFFGTLFWLGALVVFEYALLVAAERATVATLGEWFSVRTLGELLISVLFLMLCSTNQYAYCDKDGRQHIRRREHLVPAGPLIAEGLVSKLRISFLSWLAPVLGKNMTLSDTIIPDQRREFTVCDGWWTRWSWFGWAAVSSNSLLPWRQYSLHCPTLYRALVIAGEGDVDELFKWVVSAEVKTTKTEKISARFDTYARELREPMPLRLPLLRGEGFVQLADSLTEVIEYSRSKAGELLRECEKLHTTRSQMEDALKLLKSSLERKEQELGEAQQVARTLRVLRNTDTDSLQLAQQIEEGLVAKLNEKEGELEGVAAQRDLLGAMLATLGAWPLIRRVDGERNKTWDSPYMKAETWFVDRCLRNNIQLFGLRPEQLATLEADFLRYANRNEWRCGPKALLELRRQLTEKSLRGGPNALYAAVEEVFGDCSEWTTPGAEDGEIGSASLAADEPSKVAQER